MTRTTASAASIAIFLQQHHRHHHYREGIRKSFSNNISCFCTTMTLHGILIRFNESNVVLRKAA
jgi:hypothetical protein